MQKIAIIGSGFIGRAWAISFARAGYAVVLWDEHAGAPGKALTYIEVFCPIWPPTSCCAASRDRCPRTHARRSHALKKLG